jgi:hypothetical protein
MVGLPLLVDQRKLILKEVPSGIFRHCCSMDDLVAGRLTMPLQSCRCSKELRFPSGRFGTRVVEMSHCAE